VYSPTRVCRRRFWFLRMRKTPVSPRSDCQGKRIGNNNGRGCRVEAIAGWQGIHLLAIAQCQDDAGVARKGVKRALSAVVSGLRGKLAQAIGRFQIVCHDSVTRGK